MTKKEIDDMIWEYERAIGLIHSFVLSKKYHPQYSHWYKEKKRLESKLEALKSKKKTPPKRGYMSNNR